MNASKRKQTTKAELTVKLCCFCGRLCCCISAVVSQNLFFFTECFPQHVDTVSWLRKHDVISCHNVIGSPAKVNSNTLTKTTLGPIDARLMTL